MGTATIQIYVCDRCSHRWAPRQNLDSSEPIPMPTVCPRCKSPYWNKPRKLKKEKGD